MDGIRQDPDESSERVGLDQLFDLGAHLYSTRTSEAVQAVEKISRDPVLLWLLRFPLDTNSEVVSRFIRRLDQIKSVETAVPALRSYGVEPGGTAYLAMEVVDGERLIEKSWSPRDAERHFLEAVRIVADLHVQKILVGDICEDSFLVDDNEGVKLIGIMGTFEVEAKRTAALPAVHTLPFISPEQRSGTGSDLASDVYALGILGYRLFTGRYPTPDKNAAPIEGDPLAGAAAPSSIRASLPAWVDDILGHCVQADAEERFSDAVQLFTALETAISTGQTSGGGRWSNRGLIVRPTTDSVRVEKHEVEKSAERNPAPMGSREAGGLKDRRGTEMINEATGKKVTEGARQEGLGPKKRPAAQTGVPQENSDWAAPKPSRHGFLLGVVTFVVLIMGVGIAILKFATPKIQEPKSETQELYNSAPPELKSAVNDLTAGGVSREQKKRALVRIAKSDDPAAYTLLYQTIRFVPDDEIRALGRKSVLLRLEKAGLPESAKIVEGWFAAAERLNVDAAQTAVFPYLLSATDRSLAAKVRQAGLLQVHKKNKDLALQLGAALAIDTMASGEFVPSLRKLLELSDVKENLEGKGVGPLILSHRGLSIVFEQKMAQLLPQFSGDDLRLALRSLADSDSNVLPDVAREVLRRDIADSYQQVFLRALVTADRFKTSRPLKRSLVDASTGVITRTDLENFTLWDNDDLPELLLATCAIATDPRVATAALETLISRQLGNEPALSLLNWVKASTWEFREKLAKAVGILGLVDRAKPEEIEYAFDQLMPYTAKGSLLKAVLNGGDSRLISRTIERTGPIIPNADLLALLNPNKDKSIRLAAVRALEGRNGLDVLHAILRAYEREPDDEVKAVYREKHWVIKNRETGGGAPQTVPPAQ